MTVRMYNDNYRYTDAGDECDDATHKAAKVIFNKFVEMGCSPREISKIMQDAIRDLELAAVL